MSQQKIPERKDIPDDHKWDLKPLFRTDEDWEKMIDINVKGLIYVTKAVLPLSLISYTLSLFFIRLEKTH